MSIDVNIIREFTGGRLFAALRLDGEKPTGPTGAWVLETNL